MASPLEPDRPASPVRPCRRPPPGKRAFVSDAVERSIVEVAKAVADPELAWLFSNCLPNTLDTTVTLGVDAKGRPDAFVITGDIPAMWLRDSTNQIWPYLPLVGQDPKLHELFRGLINRQAACVRLDPYANAFYKDADEVGHWKSDRTVMRPGVHERKYELDSHCAVMRLAHGFWSMTGDTRCFDADWLEAVRLMLATIRHEQQSSAEQGDRPAYRFSRATPNATDTLANRGRGNPFARTGMSRSAFRPSDDATIYQHLVPANAMAVVCLRNLAEMLTTTHLGGPLANEAKALADDIDKGLRDHAVVQHPTLGRIWAYEVDGFGGRSLMDDANVPSLLGLPYLGYCRPDDPVYQATRRFVLGEHNPYYFTDPTHGDGVGGPHVGPGWVWPMSVTIRALTSTDDAEITRCLRQLARTHAGTGFMHETYWKSDPAKFTRPWFAWANSLFGELILTLHRDKPHVLATTV